MATRQKINFSQITVVIQGPIFTNLSASYPLGETVSVVESVRSFLPGAKIIISTWKGAGYDNLGADRCVYSDDPGALPYGPGDRLHNVNRQITLMKAGLSAVDTKWVLKLRSDTLLTSDSITKYVDSFNARSPFCKIFENRIITMAPLTCNVRADMTAYNSYLFLFHVNEMIQFGLIGDMRKLWDIPLMPDEDFSFFSLKNDSRGRPYGRACRRVPEDYIWTTVLARDGIPINNSWDDVRPELVPVSELSIVNNFCLLDFDDMGIFITKYPDFSTNGGLNSGFFNHREWIKLYQIYCDVSVEIPKRKIKANHVLAFLNPLFLFRYIKKRTRPIRNKFKVYIKNSLKSLCK